MTSSRARRAVVPALALSALVPLASALPATAGSTRTSGAGQGLWISWTEYDPDDVLGLPGNVHVGFLHADEGPWGRFIFGNVTDFDCDPGETPWGGGHAVAAIAGDGADVVEAATEDAIDAVVDSGGAVIESGAVVAAIADGIGEEVPDEIIDEFPVCDYIQDRFLDGSTTATLTVDVKRKTASITGKLLVHGGHGDHGEPGPVLGRPPINLTIEGGDWTKFESSYSARGKNWSYRDSYKGTSYDGGIVSGAIGAMGFADDPDDESYASFSSYRYSTVERIR